MPIPFVDRDPRPPGHEQLPWRAVDRMLSISTGHVPEATAKALDDAVGTLSGDLWHRLVILKWGDYGWIFWCSAEHAAAARNLGHEDLAAVIEFAINNGFDWLRLDCDALKLDQLPTFDW